MFEMRSRCSETPSVNSKTHQKRAKLKQLSYYGRTLRLRSTPERLLVCRALARKTHFPTDQTWGLGLTQTGFSKACYENRIHFLVSAPPGLPAKITGGPGYRRVSGNSSRCRQETAATVVTCANGHLWQETHS